MVPRNFEEWRNCIVNDCKIELTREFASKRLAIYQDMNNAETKKFLALYGEQHLSNIINWLQRV